MDATSSARRLVFERAITWARTADAEFPYQGQVDGEYWLVRVNDWPDDSTVYTLIRPDGTEFDFDNWPPAWIRPPTG